MVYYSYAWVLTLLNDSPDKLTNRLFDDKIEAWVHGPVIASLYNDYADYGFNDIPQQDEKVTFPSDVENVLEQVLEVYGKYNANELESLTHQETPWKNARKDCSPLERSNNPIADEDIYNCYIKRVG